MSRDAERTAFARAASYLNYRAAARATAYAAAAGSAFLLVLLLALLALFADVAVHRGQLPAFRDLARDDQDRVFEDWWQLDEAQRASHIRKKLQLTEERQAALARAGEDDLSTEDRALLGSSLWLPMLHRLLEEKVSPDAAEQVRGREDEPAHGILGLVARSAYQERFYAPLVSALARWNPWAWHSTSGVAIFSPYVFGLFLLAVLLAGLRTLLTLLMHEMAARASIEAATRLRRAVYHHTFRLGTLAFRALGPSEAVTVFTRHVEAVHDALYLKLTTWFRDPVQIALLLLFALFFNFGLALAFLLFALLVWVVGSQVAAHYRKQGRLATHDASERLTLIRESLMIMRLIKCYMMELFNQSRVERQLAGYAKAQLRRYRGDSFYRPLLVLIGAVAAFCLLYVAGIIVIQGRSGVGSLIAMTTSLVLLYGPVDRMLTERRVMQRGREAALQLFRFLDRPSEVGQVVGAEFLPGIERQIEFDNVSLREPGSGRMLLQNISLTIKAGQRIGIVGTDDLEKYALVYLIPRLLDPTTGEIRLDSHNLRWVTLDSLRDKIATVLIHNLVFHDTVANNIGCGDPSHTLPKIIEAAKLARAHQFIQKLPQGYETPIGELGHSLSLSKKFRIALARAVLRDPALLILEEPEEGLDDETKALVDDALARFLPGRTVIFLPHRVSTIRSCDRIFVLHNGRLEASGVHKELLAQNRLYRHLHYIEFNEMAEVV
jgi:ATP-binding cassette subfamily B protein